MPRKNTAQLQLFEQTVYEYFVLLSPSDEIKEAVDTMKQSLDNEIGLDTANLKSIAHISLFKTEGTDDSTIKRLVKKVAAQYEPLYIRINGYEVLKHGNASKTLCLNIENPEKINNMLSKLIPPVEIRKSYRQTSILDKPKRTPKVHNPHITVARNIPIADFTRISNLEDFNYNAQWLCTHITILRRTAGSTGHFSPCAIIAMGEAKS